MKHTALVSVVFVLTLTACDKKPSQEPFIPTPVFESSDTLPAGHPPVNSADQATALTDAADAAQTQTATVISSIDIPQFTYIEVKQNNQTRWLAASTIAAKKGDIIKFDNGSTMENFSSKALNRTFPSITFVNHASVIKWK
ncbi:MAG: hypothetical protein ACOY9D_10725 [Pseudomonadota bacterium]